MEVWQALFMIAIGCVAGFLNVLSGGGSLVTVPVMLMMDMPGPVANGTNRIAILAQNFTAVVTFFKKGYSDFRLSLSLAVAALPGAVIGALLGTRLEGEWFDRLVAFVMIAVMIVMATSKSGGKSEAQSGPQILTRKRLIWGHVCMVAAGFWGGFIQMGVGFILMPILHRVMGLDLVRVNMHKVFIILFYTFTVLAIFAWKVEILWMLGIFLAIGNSIGGWLGAHLSVKRGEKVITIVLNIVLTGFIIKLLFF